eukprot:s2366_g4.t1
MINPSELRNVFIQNAPADPANLLVRPEVRAMSPGYAKPENQAEYAWRCLETYSPGNALMERTNCMWGIRIISVLFGHSQGTREYFYQNVRTVTRLAVYRNFPEPGQHAWYRLVFVFSTPEDSWTHASLCRQHFAAFTDMFHKMIERVVNGPGFCDMREADAKMYLVLSMRAFNRGPPMIPHDGPCSEESFNMLAGEHLGLVSWTRFKPDEKFHLSEYLRCFMDRLGHQLQIYEVMDGRKLVPYQCAVVRWEWDQVRASFYEAFKEDVAPHFLPGVHPGDSDSQFSVPKRHTTVRKTFVELDEEDDLCNPRLSKQLKRSISTGEVMTCFV